MTTSKEQCVGILRHLKLAAAPPIFDEVTRILGNRKIGENERLWKELGALYEIVQDMQLLQEGSLDSTDCTIISQRRCDAKMEHIVPPLKFRVASDVLSSRSVSMATISSGLKSSHIDSASTNARFSDPVDFVLSIQHLLNPEGIFLAVEDFKYALDFENQALDARIKDLWKLVDGEADVIATSRSTTKDIECASIGANILPMSTVSTKFASNKAMSNSYLVGLCVQCGGKLSGPTTAGAPLLSSSSSSSSSSFSLSNASKCSRKATDSRLRASKSTAEKTNMNPLSLSFFDGADRTIPNICPDCRVRGAIESPTEPLVELSAKQPQLCKEAMSFRPSTGTSKFKSRLQAARDEHHFFSDDYLG